MEYTRRRFLEAAGSIVAAATYGCAGSSPTGQRLSGATGVELNVAPGALPDYSHDLERYLVRRVSDARARRKQAIEAIATRQDVIERQKTVTDELWKML